MSGCHNDAGKLFHILGPAAGETHVSKLSVCSRNSDDVGVCGAKLAASGLSSQLAVVRHVRLGLLERLVDDGGQFIDDSLLHWKPVKT